jgi:acetylornithine/N-succinyldiaminopimelate aminotransferase
MGRLGSLFAYKKFNVIPDVICIAKALGGGFPIGAFIANERALTLVPGDHGSTYGGNPLGCAVSLAVLNELIDGGIINTVEEKGAYIRQKLSGLKNRYGIIDEVKGMGLLIGISLKTDPKAFMNSCFDKGLLVVTAGANVVRLLPPLNVTLSEIDEALSILENVLAEMAA